MRTRLTATLFVLLWFAPTGAPRAEGPEGNSTPDTYAVPADQVRVDGDRKLNLRCSGTGAPVVILEAGGNADSSTWFRVLPRLAKSTRVCAYDRAGYGFSDEGPLPRNLDATVADLHALIAAGEIATPVLLVGHSLGSNIVRRYAQLHRSDVAGLVLVDPPEQGSDERMPKDWQEQIAAQVEHRDHVLNLCERAAEADDADTMTGQCLRPAPPWMSSAVGAAMTRNKSQPRYWRTLRSELASNTEVFAAPVPLGESYGAMPLVLLRAGDQPDDAPPEVLEIAAAARAETHARILAASTRSEVVDVADTSHDIQLDQPDAVVSAVVRLLDALASKPLAPAND